MEIINKTVEGTKEYPRHNHKRYEIMHYVSGSGFMWTERGELPFSEGTVIVMPPDVLHGSVSTDCFVNVSIESDFDGLFFFDTPLSMQCEGDDGSKLIDMIWANRYGNDAYLHSLCVAYARYLLQKAKPEGGMSRSVGRIVKLISDGACDPETDVAEILRQSGYAEDYIRMRFRQEVGKTPIAFLTELRIKRACYMIDLYKDVLTLSEIAEKCGYTDYVYFSKKFKEYVGVSPNSYKKA